MASSSDVDNMTKDGAIDPKDFGAKADGQANDTAAIQAAIDQAAERGGGTVELGLGRYRSGTLFLRSGLTLEIRAGACLEAIPDPELYPFIEPGVRTRMDTVAWRAFLYACGAEDITLRGEGIIEGNGGDEAFKVDLKGNDPRRPYGLHFVQCRRVTVEGLRLRNSAFWMQRYLDCESVELRGLRVWNHAETRNNDGCDIDGCRDVVVSDCIIDSTDDALCLKAEGPASCENIAISNCVLSSFASPLKFGTGSVGDFRNITVSNIVIRPSACPTCHHVMGAMGGLSGIDIGCVDGGTFERVSISNVTMSGVECPIFIKLGERHSFNLHGGEWEDAPGVKPGAVRQVRISNVVAQDVGPYPCCVVGYAGQAVEDIWLSGIDIRYGRAVVDEPDWEVDVMSKRYPANRVFKTELPAYGLYAAHVQGLRMRDVALRAAEGEARPAIGLQNVEGARLDTVEAGEEVEAQVVARDSRGIRFDGEELE